MKRYRVKVAVKTLELYEVEADTPEDAADGWGLGRLLDADDEALESEVLSVEQL
jgi:hypothetical protein